MADDFVLNVRQIAQYPLLEQVGDADCLLVQQGGLGGPYRSVRPFGLLSSTTGVAIGLKPTLPNAGLVAWSLTTRFGPQQGFNWYADQTGVQRFLAPGVALQQSFDGNNYGIAASNAVGVANGIIYGWQPLLTLSIHGELSINRQITVGRQPTSDMEVTTRSWVIANSVTSFNGRTGAITLTAEDCNAAFGLKDGDSLASKNFVWSEVCRGIEQMFYRYPFVFSFNNRVGAITLTATDISAALFADKPNATAPTPPFGDVSHRIATTAFVDETIVTATADTASQTDLESFQSYVDTTFAPLDSPQFTGLPSGPTAALGTHTGQLATTAFVMDAIEETTAGVVSFNGRAGIVTLQDTDLTDVGGALLASPAFTGVPTAPTAAPGTDTTQLATTAFVEAAVAASTAGVATFNGRTGNVVLVTADITGAGGAPQISPAFGGVPTAPTAAPGTSTVQLATTAFVMANLGVTSFMGRTGAITLTAADISSAGGAPSASPAFTGTPTAPTATAGTNTTQLATTAFVQAAIGAGGGVTTFNGRAGAVTLSGADVQTASPYTAWSFTAAGSPAWSTPANSTTATVYRIRQVAGGGGGCAPISGGTFNGAGGGGGEFMEWLLTGVPPNTAAALTIGAAGQPTGGGTLPSNGTATTFAIGTLSVTCNPGLATATLVNQQSPGNGGRNGAFTPGSTYTATLLLRVGGGDAGALVVPQNVSPGGSSFWAPRGAVVLNSQPATGFGAGGGGSVNFGTLAGAATGGAMIIERVSG